MCIYVCAYLYIILFVCDTQTSKSHFLLVSFIFFFLWLFLSLGLLAPSNGWLTLRSFMGYDLRGQSVKAFPILCGFPSSPMPKVDWAPDPNARGPGIISHFFSVLASYIWVSLAASLSLSFLISYVGWGSEELVSCVPAKVIMRIKCEDRCESSLWAVKCNGHSVMFSGLHVLCHESLSGRQESKERRNSCRASPTHEQELERSCGIQQSIQEAGLVIIPRQRHLFVSTPGICHHRNSATPWLCLFWTCHYYSAYFYSYLSTLWLLLPHTIVCLHLSRSASSLS